MALDKYKRKRDFAKTPEPAGTTRKRTAPGRLSFVVQKHAARRLHYDFRLELDGVLKSWAVPKGPSLDPADRRLAVHVEDHPIEYGGFEGVIPQGEYGGGTVMLWDRGWWKPEGDPRKDYAKGHLRFTLHGEKLQGGWSLVRLDGRDRSKDNWFLIKHRDDEASAGNGAALVDRATASVLTGREMPAIADERNRVWTSGKGEVKPNGPPSAKAGAKSPAVDPTKIAGAKRGKANPDIEPELATLTKVAPAGDEWLHEIKFDGYRMIAHVKDGKARFHSRNGLDWTKRFPALSEGVARLAVKEAVLDGEVVHMLSNGTTSFSALQNDLSDEKTDALVYMVFDLLFLDGWNLGDAKLEDRKTALRGLLETNAIGRIRYSDHQIGRGPEFLAGACRLALEGIVSKRRDARYRRGRNPSWVKVKCGAREELLVVGFTDPAGARSGFGALLLGYFNPQGKLVYAGKVGTGYSTKFLIDFRKRLKAIERKTPTVILPKGISSRGVHWVKPKIIVETSFTEWTADGVLRHPRFLGIREDKSPDEIILDRSGPAASVAGAADPDVGAKVGRDGAAMISGFRITHAERVLYPETGITKLVVAEYYAEVAGWMLPHIVNRPLSLLRCPEGMASKCFFQKHLHAGVPDAVGRVEIAEKDGESQTYLTVGNLEGLLALVQMGVMEIHPWGSTVGHIERPDRLIFDLDPDEGLGWDRVLAAAIAVRDLLADLGLRSFPKTTGGKGLHLVVPIKPELEWDAAKAFTRAVAAKLADEAPDLYTVSLAKKARVGRIFIDYLRNGRGATAVAPYSTRAKAAGTVSAPLTWHEVESGIRADHFTIETLPPRLRSLQSDPWADLPKVRQSISMAVRRKLGIKF